MNKPLFDEFYLSVRCSAMVEMPGGAGKTFIVNYDYFDTKISKQCGIQLPQFSVAYNDGFSEDEIEYLLDKTYEDMHELIAMAKETPAREDAEYSFDDAPEYADPNKAI